MLQRQRYSLVLTNRETEVINKKLIRWTFGEAGGLSTETFAKADIIKWKGFDGLPLSGFIYKPQMNTRVKRPVLIEIHGGPEAQARPEFLQSNNYLINELGLVIIQPNIRGSSGFGKTFLKADDGLRRMDAYKDIESLIDWVKKQPDLDAERIMLTGGSYGGIATLAAVTFFGDKIRCGLSVAGASNLVSFLENTSDYRQDLRRVEYGDERDAATRNFLESIAPLNNIAKIKKPLFIVQGANDPKIPTSEAEQMVNALNNNNTPAWYLLAKDEGHGYGKKSNQDYLLYATILFIEKYLLDD